MVIHERLAHWTRQLRPYEGAWSVRLIETRSSDELFEAVSRAGTCVVVARLGDDPAGELGRLHEALTASPGTLCVLHDPLDRPGVQALARELGAAVAWGSEALPPEVVRLLERFTEIIRERRDRGGWFDPAWTVPADDLDAWIEGL